MCLILFKHQPTDHYPLILVANRDEYHQRNSQVAGYWEQSPQLFGGIDLVAGGSWLSVDKKGRLATVTNIRKPPFSENTKQSRGSLVYEFLNQDETAYDYLVGLNKHDEDYGLFNLLLFDASGLWHYSNDTHQITAISPGVHGVSNASLNTPWPKLMTAKTSFERSLNSGKVNTLELLSIMQSQTRPSDDLLPKTGISLEFERFLSSIFIQGDDYGTRCTTLLTIDAETVQFLEVSYDQQGQIKHEAREKIERHY